MSCPSCRPCAGLLARCARPTAAATARPSRLRPLHQSSAAAAAAFTAQSAAPGSAVPAPATRPRARREGAGAARDFHATTHHGSITGRLGDMARQAVRRTVEPYGAFGVTRQIYQKCSRQAAYEIAEETRRDDLVPTTEDGEEIGVGGGMWHDDFGLLPSFSSWSQVTMLHMYLVVTRLRCFDKETYHLWQSMITDHFFQEAEDRMDRVHHISSRGLRQRHLQDLFMTWRGIIVAYDEGLVRSDAVLASALWRNLFKARPDMDLRSLAAVVAWVRRSLAMLDRMPDETLVLHGGSGIFSWPPATAFLGAVDEPASKELSVLLAKAAETPPPSSSDTAASDETPRAHEQAV